MLRFNRPDQMDKTLEHKIYGVLLLGLHVDDILCLERFLEVLSQSVKDGTDSLVVIFFLLQLLDQRAALIFERLDPLGQLVVLVQSLLIGFV